MGVLWAVVSADELFMLDKQGFGGWHELPMKPTEPEPFVAAFLHCWYDREVDAECPDRDAQWLVHTARRLHAFCERHLWKVRLLCDMQDEWYEQDFRLVDSRIQSDLEGLNDANVSR